MIFFVFFFFFNDTATTEIYTLSLHDALPLRRRIVRRARNRPLPRPPKIRDCFSPCFGAERVAGEALDVLTRLVGLPAFERFQYRQVQGHPPLVQEARVRNFMCQRVLERVLRLREEAGVIEELGGLEVRERPAEVFLPR